MNEQRLEEIWRDNLSKYNGNVRLDSIIIRAMHEACNEVESKFKNLTLVSNVVCPTCGESDYNEHTTHNRCNLCDAKF